MTLNATSNNAIKPNSMNTTIHMWTFKPLVHAITTTLRTENRNFVGMIYVVAQAI